MEQCFVFCILGFSSALLKLTGCYSRLAGEREHDRCCISKEASVHSGLSPAFLCWINAAFWTKATWRFFAASIPARTRNCGLVARTYCRHRSYTSESVNGWQLDHPWNLGVQWTASPAAFSIFWWPSKVIFRFSVGWLIQGRKGKAI